MKQSPSALRYLEEQLAALDADGLLRTRPEVVPDVSESFCSNDYLGLAHEVVSAGHAGAGASRLIVGERPEHGALERGLAEWLGTEAALLFSSGYAANVGVISALAGPSDLVVSDQLNHASIIDGCRLSRARIEIIPHLGTREVEILLRAPRRGRAYVVTESYFSMDADTPDLVELRRICDLHGAALVVDEAHAVGVFGPRGTGLCTERGVTPDVLVGTLGKAFGAAGAFVAGSDALVRWLWNRARTFVFSTGASPAVAAAALRSLGTIKEDGARRERLHRNAQSFRAGLARIGLSARGHGPILPVVIGDSRRAVLVAESLRAEGVYVQAVRPPTVPVGTARLRVTVTATQTAEGIERALGAFERTWARLGSSS